jgi:hypothetical protein
MLQIVNERVGRWIREAVTCSGVWKSTGTENTQSLTKVAVPSLALLPSRWS